MSLLRRIPEVNPRAAAERLGDGAVVLDVREHHEWHAGRIAGALHIPMGELAFRQAEIPTGRSVIVVCRSGNRSAAVAEVLLRAGYDAENLAGGMESWKAAGLPLDPPDGWIA
jgi:rhodanese-related sulfurtransferase